MIHSAVGVQGVLGDVGTENFSSLLSEFVVDDSVRIPVALENRDFLTSSPIDCFPNWKVARHGNNPTELKGRSESGVQRKGSSLTKPTQNYPIGRDCRVVVPTSHLEQKAEVEWMDSLFFGSNSSVSQFTSQDDMT